MKKGAGALGLAILGAVFVPSWPVQLICYLTVALTLLSLLYTSLARRAVIVERDTAEIRAHAHTTARVELTVKNTSFLPLAYVAVVDHQGGLRALEPAQTVVTLPAGGTHRFGYTLKTMGRGVHELGPVSVGGADPLGLFPWWTTLKNRCRVTVLPEVGLIRVPANRGSLGGDGVIRDPVFEDMSRFRAVREYVSGDPPPRIHWKTTARLGSLHTVEYEPAMTCPCLVVLDLRLDGYPLRSRYHFVERAIETAATLVLEAAHGHQAAGLLSNGALDPGPATVSLGKGMEHALHILSVLARIAPVGEDTLPAAELAASAPRPPAGTRVCLVGPRLERETLERLRAGVSSRLEVYRIMGAPPGEGEVPGVRTYTIHPYGEVLAGD